MSAMPPSICPYARLVFLFALALLTGARPATAADVPVVPLDDAVPTNLFTVVNGSLQRSRTDGASILRWQVNAGQSSELAVRADHPLFARLRYYDRLQFDFRIASGEANPIDVCALGHVSGARQYKVHEWTVAIVTTPRGAWQHRELDLARPNWFPWDNPDGEGGEGYLKFQAMALTADTVIEIRNLRLVRNLVYLKPDYDLPVTWPVKTNAPDGGVVYSMTFHALNMSGKPTEVTARIESPHGRFALALDKERAAVKASQTVAFTLTATLSAVDAKALPELYEEPWRVVFATSDAPDVGAFREGVFVRPLSPALHRQVIAPAGDVAQIRAKLKGGDAILKVLVHYDRVIAEADKLVATRLDHIPGGHAHVNNGLPEVPGRPGKALQPGSFMPEVVDADTGFREAGTLLAQQFWKEYLAFGGGCENLGMAYLLTGEEKYAEKAVELMELYARQYTELDWGNPLFDPPWNSGPNILCSSRISANSSYGSNWQMKWHCRMLAMIADSAALTPARRAHIYQGFVLPYALELIKFPGGISNMTDISNHNLLLLGLVFDDAHLVRHALRSDAGLLRRMNDIGADGFSSEGRPVNYHLAAMAEYVPALVSLELSGLKLDYPRERMLTALRMPFQRATLTGHIPATGDCGRGQPRAAATPLADALLSLFPNESWLLDIGAASTLSKQLRLTGNGGKPDPAALRRMYETTPRLFAQAGFAILRRGATPAEQIMVTLDYGRNVMHGALDRNQITLCAFGRVFTQGPGSLYNAGSGIKGSEDKRIRAFCSHSSLGQNVVLVDARDQLPAVGTLLAWNPKDDHQVAVSRVSAYPGVSHTRGVALTEGLVLMLDRIESDEEHTCDFVYHNFGKLTPADGWSVKPETKPMAHTALYDQIVDLKRLADSGTIQLTWDLSDQNAAQSSTNSPLTLVLRQLAVPGGELYTGLTGLNNPNTGKCPDAVPSMLHRVRGKRVEFATVLEPCRGPSWVRSLAPRPGGGMIVTLTGGKLIEASMERWMESSKNRKTNGS